MDNAFTQDWLHKKNIIQDRLLELISTMKSLSVLYAPMEHSIFSGGKRLRAVIVLNTFEAFSSASNKAALEAACALELIHSFSLVHDDLPCMDNDEYRRGKKTTHALYGEDIGLLTGDALFAFAFQILSSIPAETLSPASSLHLVHVLSQKGGLIGMIEGQAMECYQESAFEITQKTFFSIIQHKTSALFSAAFMMGCICAEQPEKTIELFETIGLHFGNAFQITDDYHDRQNKHEKSNAFQLFSQSDILQLFHSELDAAESLISKASIQHKQKFLDIFQWLRHQIQ
jgi:geranylgeranyl diphosphate synthase, type II